MRYVVIERYGEPCLVINNNKHELSYIFDSKEEADEIAELTQNGLVICID